MTTKTQPIGYALWFGDEAIPYRFAVLFCKTCGKQHPRVDEMDELLDLAGDTFACENCGTEVRRTSCNHARSATSGSYPNTTMTEPSCAGKQSNANNGTATH